MAEQNDTNTTQRTRQLFIESARQVFIKLGVAHTTMNDIAEASGKGRRTLYTYFKSKDEIYSAVVEQEMNHLIERLSEIADKDMPVADKLIEYIYVHLYAVREIVDSNGTVHGDFFNDMRAVEMVRRKTGVQELRMLRGILEDGKAQGVFEIVDVDMAAMIILNALKGLEIPYLRFPNVATRMVDLRDAIARFVFKGLSATNSADLRI